MLRISYHDLNNWLLLHIHTSIQLELSRLSTVQWFLSLTFEIQTSCLGWLEWSQPFLNSFYMSSILIVSACIVKCVFWAQNSASWDKCMQVVGTASKRRQQVTHLSIPYLCIKLYESWKIIDCIQICVHWTHFWLKLRHQLNDFSILVLTM